MKEIITRIKSRCDMAHVVAHGGGLGMTVEQRVAPVVLFKPELAYFNAGSINFALFPLLEIQGVEIRLGKTVSRLRRGLHLLQHL